VRDEIGEERSRSQSNLSSARGLDQEGVRAYQEGRYADAIRYFREAYRMGGPSSELWNIARSFERLDDPEQAVAVVEEYLGQRDLLPQDRADAEHELQALRARPSMLTVTTTPPGAIITVDGKQSAGPTPVTVELRPGAHTIAIRREGYRTETRPLDARLGRAIIVSLDLRRADK
jgi:hypothetical protein